MARETWLSRIGANLKLSHLPANCSKSLVWLPWPSTAAGAGAVFPLSSVGAMEAVS